MVYNYQFVPPNKEVYCVGFRYGRTKPIVNRKPTLGVVKDDSCWRRFVPNEENERTIELRQYASSYYFADTYAEAANKYNDIIEEAYEKYFTIADKIGDNFINFADTEGVLSR